MRRNAINIINTQIPNNITQTRAMALSGSKPEKLGKKNNNAKKIIKAQPANVALC